MSAAPHVPVLLEEVIAALDPQPGDVVVDATFGAGGYTRALLDRGATVHAFDRDPDAIAFRAIRRQSTGSLIPARVRALAKFARTRTLSSQSPGVGLKRRASSAVPLRKPVSIIVPAAS